MNENFEIVIGLEVHAELNTKSKIFCACKNEFGAEVNTLCCPVCTGMPGTLPILNKQVVNYAIMMGHALNCDINNITKLDRKNYFYPDLPKAYQISQFDVPICVAGHLDILMNGEVRRIGITRIHIEEDAGKLIHDDESDGTLADYNRCGVPLIEIVSEPDMRSAHEAKIFMESITDILLYLGISNARMEEGNVRADVNVSIRPKGQKEFGTRTEMKNINSFNAAHRAILWETARQIEIVSKGGVIEQETRRWDDTKNKSILMRTKEDAQDYRYFPDPDLLTFAVSAEKIKELKAMIPELPLAKAKRYMARYELSEYDALQLCSKKAKADFFEKAIAYKICEAKAIANWLSGDVLMNLNTANIELENTALTPKNLAKMIGLIEKNTISGTAAKKVLKVIMEKDVAPTKVVEELGLGQISDSSELTGIVNNVLSANPKAVEDFKNGKTNVLGFLLGQCMKASRGQGNPALLGQLITNALNAL